MTVDAVAIQSCDATVYFDMFIATSRTVRALCRRSGAEYQAFIGIKRGYVPWHATYNRIIIFEELLRAGFRGWVLYIDADAFVNDPAFDIARFLDERREYAFVGAPSGVSDHFWDLNIGVLFLNFGHPFARDFAREWHRRFFSYSDEQLRSMVEWGKGPVPSDQGLFHMLLQQHSSAALYVKHEPRSFMNSPQASFIRQRLRANAPAPEARAHLIADETDRVMTRLDAPAS